MTSTKQITENQNHDMITMCVCCKSVKIEGTWLDYTLAHTFVDIRQKSNQMLISHSICNNCGISFYGEKARHIFEKKE